MSLYYFHAFLIASAGIFGFYFAWVEFSAYSKSAEVLILAAAVSSLAASIALLVYLVWFVRKKLLK